jgi:peptide/nickel transport system substrate-binding protein
MNQFVSWEFSTKENKWQGRNITRWQNSEYDAAYKAAQVELDPVKRAALFIKMNDLVVQNRAIIAVVSRPRVRASNLRLKVPESGWDSDFWALQDWYREGTPPA